MHGSAATVELHNNILYTSHTYQVCQLTFTGDLRGEWEGADGHGVDGSAVNVPIFGSLCSPLSCVFSSCTSWNSLFCSDKKNLSTTL